MTGRVLAEDVYYVSRDELAVYGLNQLTSLPAELSRVELQAIENMCERSIATMGRRTSATARAEVTRDVTHDDLMTLGHGLYYVDPLGFCWTLDADDERPDLAGKEMDFAVAVVRTGLDTLQRLRSDLPQA